MLPLMTHIAHSTRSFALRHPIFWAFVYVGFFSIPFQSLIYVSGMSGTVGLRQALLMSTLWLIPLLIWPRSNKIMTALIGIFLWLGGSVAIGYWLIYGQEFSQSAIFVIFETTPAESTEFIESYFRWWHGVVFAVFTAIPLLLWHLMPPLLLPAKVRYRYASVFLLIVSWPFVSVLFVKDLGIDEAFKHLARRLEPAAPWNLVVGYAHYRDQMTAMESMLVTNNKLSPLGNFATDEAFLPANLVLVIGESTNRQRMSLYGYPRATTPRLDQIRDELLVFSGAVTPRPYTIEALQEILSFAGSRNPDDFFTEPNIINMMKQAGYEITWITNQQTQTGRNNMLTMLSQLADKQIYLNNNRAQNANQYDGQVIEPVLNTLQESADRKMIVVHLLGTHRKYKYRYPNSFVTFTDDQDIPIFVSPENLSEYNNYDDAIIYNDYVVAELIAGLKAHGDNSLLVYLSDHGEEVYDYPQKPFAGRNEASPTSAMYTVPFIVWSSPDSAVNQNFSRWQSYSGRPFSTTDFIYSLSDMVGVSYDRMDYSRSIVSEQFTHRPRWIKDGNKLNSLLDYDQHAGMTEPVILAD
jgi:heptose-I-phosphate ethanolaminephosphotransferase